MLRSVFVSLILGLALPGAGWAQTSQQSQSEGGQAAAKVLRPADLPQSLGYVERGPASSALQRLATVALEVDPEGNVNAETLAVYHSILIARSRARAFQRLVEIDLDFDGNITAAERVAVLSRLDARRRVDVALVLSGADLDGDDVISAQEVREAVRGTELTDRQSENRMQQARDLMFFDVDADGEVTLKEMARAVRAMFAE